MSEELQIRTIQKILSAIYAFPDSKNRNQNNKIKLPVVSKNDENNDNSSLISDAIVGNIRINTPIKGKNYPIQKKTVTEDSLLRYLNDRNDELTKQRQERLQQAHMTFYVSICSLIFGLAVVLTGILLLFSGNVSGGTVTASVGIVSNFISVIIFKFNKDSNDRLDLITDKLAVFDRTSLTLHMLKQFTDTRSKDKALQFVITNLSQTGYFLPVERD